MHRGRFLQVPQILQKRHSLYINELTSGIKTTAEELGTAYDEAYKYAEKATTSLREVVDGIQVIADGAKKIKEISI